mgnify:CR=1 FL=1
MPLMKLCICIDFDPDFFYLIQTYAERSGLGAVHVQGGLDILAVINREQPAVICLDGDKPARPTAWHLLSRLKSDPAINHIPVIFFSWLDEEERSIQEGADVFVQKAVMYADFIDALAMAGVLDESAKPKKKAKEEGGGSAFSQT